MCSHQYIRFSGLPAENGCRDRICKFMVSTPLLIRHRVQRHFDAIINSIKSRFGRNSPPTRIRDPRSASIVEPGGCAVVFRRKRRHRLSKEEISGRPREFHLRDPFIASILAPWSKVRSDDSFVELRRDSTVKARKKTSILISCQMLTYRERFVKITSCCTSRVLHLTRFISTLNVCQRICWTVVGGVFKHMHDTWKAFNSVKILHEYVCSFCSRVCVIRKCRWQASFACSRLSFMDSVGNRKDKSVTSRWTSSWHIFHSSLVEARAFVLASDREPLLSTWNVICCCTWYMINYSVHEEY